MTTQQSHYCPNCEASAQVIAGTLADAVTYREQWQRAQDEHAALKAQYDDLQSRHRALVSLCQRFAAQWQALDVGDGLPPRGEDRPAVWTPLDDELTWDESPEWLRRDVEVAA